MKIVHFILKDGSSHEFEADTIEHVTGFVIAKKGTELIGGMSDDFCAAFWMEDDDPEDDTMTWVRHATKDDWYCSRCNMPSDIRQCTCPACGRWWPMAARIE